MDFKQKIAELNLPKNSYVVVGSGILGALGIRSSNDIDLIVDKPEYLRFQTLGWNKGLWGNHPVFQQGIFDIVYDWYGENVQDLLKPAQIINDVPYLSLEDVYQWKKMKARDKDLLDLELIDNYRNTH